MDERISGFIDSLKKQLEGLPEEEILEAVSYYEEYLNDAAEAGKDLGVIFLQLDSPEKIAGMIKTETSIIRAQHSPGLWNFTSVLRNAFRGATTPLAVFFLSIFVIISFSMVAVLFAGAFAAFVGAVVIVLGLIYQAFMIPSRFIPEIAGTVGMAFFGAGICILAAFGLYKLGRWFIRISTRMIRRMLKKAQKPLPDMNNRQFQGKSNSKLVVFTCLIASVVGLVLFSVSGLPMKYFIIFNSMKPENITLKTEEFDPGKINKISIATAHSHIKLIRGVSNKILLSYEQPDWLDYELGINGSTLSFFEKSNGRLPLFKLTTLHESRTEVTVSLPDRYTPGIVTLESTGGFIYITGLVENIQAKTYTGSINLDTKNTAGGLNIKANTESGVIEVNGTQTGQKTNQGIEYHQSAQTGKTIELRSSRGNINIG